MFEKGNKFGKEKTGAFEPGRNAKSRWSSKLIEEITGKDKQYIKQKFSREKLHLDNEKDVSKYLKDFFKDDVKKHLTKYF